MLALFQNEETSNAHLCGGGCSKQVRAGDVVLLLHRAAENLLHAAADNCHHGNRDAQGMAPHLLIVHRPGHEPSHNN